MTDRSEGRAEPFKSDECVNCHHPEGLHDAHGLSGCRHQTPFEYAAKPCGCRSFMRKPHPWETGAATQTQTVDAVKPAKKKKEKALPVYTEQCHHCGRGWPHKAADVRACNAKPCETCGGPPAFADATVSVRCTNCWEVEHRLADYVRSLGGIRFASRLIADALCKMADVL